jgi:hypothetical protein
MHVTSLLVNIGIIVVVVGGGYLVYDDIKSLIKKWKNKNTQTEESQ